MILKNWLNSGVDVRKSNDADIDSLNAELKKLLIKHISECKKAGITIQITQGYRSIEYQNGLYAIGRSKPGKIVTNCVGGQSPHNYKKAYDICIIKDGQVVWSGYDYDKAGKIGIAVGLDWGGSWTKFQDRPHYELKGASAEAAAAFKAKK